MRNIIILIVASLMSYSASSKDVQVLPQKHQEIVEQFVKHGNDQAMGELSGLVDFELFGQRVARSMGIPKRMQMGFIQGFAEKGRASIMSSIFSDLIHNQGNVVNPYNMKFDGQLRPMIRLDSKEGGSNYILLVIDKNLRDQIKIVDFYSASQGSLLSDIMGAAGQLYVNPNPTIFEKVFGKKIKVDQKIANTMIKIGTFQRSGRVQEAYDAIKTLPKAMQQHKLIASLAMAFAGGINDDLYRKELSNLAALHGDDPSLTFLLIDHYFFIQDYNKAFNAVRNFEQQYRVDGLTSLLKANVKMLAKDYDQSIKYANRCLELESYIEDCHWTKVNVYAYQNDFKNLINELNILKSDFGYLFTTDNFVENEIYKDFVESPAFKKWINE